MEDGKTRPPEADYDYDYEDGDEDENLLNLRRFSWIAVRRREEGAGA
jgi:hypothetical protein